MPVPKGKKYGGRAKGTPNRTTRELKAIAQKYTDKAVKKLDWLIDNGETHQVQAMAAREMLDRGHGRPSQVHATDPDAPLIPSKIALTIVDSKR